jgi:hypothetical protein
MTAGMATTAATDLRSLPISQRAGLAVLAARAAAVLGGGALFRLQDA